MWIYIDFMPTGIQKFCVTGPKGFYVHKILSKFRTDPMPRHFLKHSESETPIMNRSSATLKPTAFRVFAEDSPAIKSECFKSDSPLMTVF